MIFNPQTLSINDDCWYKLISGWTEWYGHFIIDSQDLQIVHFKRLGCQWSTFKHFRPFNVLKNPLDRSKFCLEKAVRLVASFPRHRFSSQREKRGCAWSQPISNYKPPLSLCWRSWGGRPLPGNPRGTLSRKDKHQRIRSILKIDNDVKKNSFFSRLRTENNRIFFGLQQEQPSMTKNTEALHWGKQEPALSIKIQSWLCAVGWVRVAITCCISSRFDE